MAMITYREATTQDAESIAQMHYVSWRVSYKGIWREDVLNGPLLEDRRKVWQKRLNQPTPDQHILVALSDETLCGFACAYADTDSTWGTLLDNLHVAPHLKGQGIGTILIKSIASWSYTRNPESGLFLWVLQGNSSAQKFYEKLGATNQGLETHEFPAGNLSVVHRYVWPNVMNLIK